MIVKSGVWYRRESLGVVVYGFDWLAEDSKIDMLMRADTVHCVWYHRVGN